MSRRWKPTVIPTAVTRYIDGQDREVGGAHDPVPEQDDRGEGGDEGHDHGAEVGDLRRLGSSRGSCVQATHDADTEVSLHANF